MIKNLLFTKQHTSFLMEIAPCTQNGNKRKYACLLGIESVVIGWVAVIEMLVAIIEDITRK
jgi:hypothetical protein